MVCRQASDAACRNLGLGSLWWQHGDTLLVLPILSKREAIAPIDIYLFGLCTLKF